MDAQDLTCHKSKEANEKDKKKDKKRKRSSDDNHKKKHKQDKDRPSGGADVVHTSHKSQLIQSNQYSHRPSDSETGQTVQQHAHKEKRKHKDKHESKDKSKKHKSEKRKKHKHKHREQLSEHDPSVLLRATANKPSQSVDQATASTPQHAATAHQPTATAMSVSTQPTAMASTSNTLFTTTNAPPQLHPEATTTTSTVATTHPTNTEFTMHILPQFIAGTTAAITTTPPNNATTPTSHTTATHPQNTDFTMHIPPQPIAATTTSITTTPCTNATTPTSTLPPVVHSITSTPSALLTPTALTMATTNIPTNTMATSMKPTAQQTTPAPSHLRARDNTSITASLRSKPTSAKPTDKFPNKNITYIGRGTGLAGNAGERGGGDADGGAGNDGDALCGDVGSEDREGGGREGVGNDDDARGGDGGSDGGEGGARDDDHGKDGDVLSDGGGGGGREDDRNDVDAIGGDGGSDGSEGGALDDDIGKDGDGDTDDGEGDGREGVGNDGDTTGGDGGSDDGEGDGRGDDGKMPESDDELLRQCKRMRSNPTNKAPTPLFEEATTLAVGHLVRRQKNPPLWTAVVPMHPLHTSESSQPLLSNPPSTQSPSNAQPSLEPLSNTTLSTQSPSNAQPSLEELSDTPPSIQSPCNGFVLPHAFPSIESAATAIDMVLLAMHGSGNTMLNFPVTNYHPSERCKVSGAALVERITQISRQIAAREGLPFAFDEKVMKPARVVRSRAGSMEYTAMGYLPPCGECMTCRAFKPERCLRARTPYPSNPPGGATRLAIHRDIHARTQQYYQQDFKAEHMLGQATHAMAYVRSDPHSHDMYNAHQGGGMQTLEGVLALQDIGVEHHTIADHLFKGECSWCGSINHMQGMCVFHSHYVLPSDQKRTPEVAKAEVEDELLRGPVWLAQLPPSTQEALVHMRQAAAWCVDVTNPDMRNAANELSSEALLAVLLLGQEIAQDVARTCVTTS